MVPEVQAGSIVSREFGLDSLTPACSSTG